MPVSSIEQSDPDIYTSIHVHVHIYTHTQLSRFAKRPKRTQHCALTVLQYKAPACGSSSALREKGQLRQGEGGVWKIRVCANSSLKCVPHREVAGEAELAETRPFRVIGSVANHSQLKKGPRWSRVGPGPAEDLQSTVDGAEAVLGPRQMS